MSLEQGETAKRLMELDFREHMGPLYMKSILKLLIVLLIAYQLMIVPITAIVPLAFLFIAMMMMPNSYTTDQPFKAVEAWMRLLLAWLLANSMYVVFSGGSITEVIMTFGVLPAFRAVVGLFSGEPAVMLWALSIAFFLTLPKRYVAAGEEFRIKSKIKGIQTLYEFGSGAAKGAGAEGLGNILFLVLACIGGLPLVLSWTKGDFQIITTIIWALSLLMGWMGGREARPFIGILVIGVAMIAFSYQFTGVIATQLFGQYAPAVINFAQKVGEPIGQAMDSAMKTLKDTQLLLTCPSCYYAQQTQEQQVESSTLTSGGTTRSIELTEFSAINYEEATPQIDPSIPLIGTIELQNQGEFTGKDVSVTLGKPSVLNPAEFSAANPSKGKYSLSDDACFFSTCTGTEATHSSTTINYNDTCAWTDKEIMPEELKLMTFKCGAISQAPDVKNWTAGTGPCSKDASGCNFYQCYYANKSDGKCYCEDITCVIDKWTSEMDKCVHKAGCPGPGKSGYPADTYCKNGQECYTLFTHGGWFVRIPFTYAFEYDANVSLPVDFMNSTTFTEKLLSKEIKLESRTSSYTGGPVKVSIFVQKQPLRSGEESFGRISVVNNGKGNITSVQMALFVPYGYDKGGMKGMKLTVVPTEVSKSANIVECTNPDFPSIGGIKYFVTSCTATGIEPDKSASYAFNFKYDISDPTVEKKSAIFFGDADYIYKTAADTDLTIAKAPIGQ